MPIFLIFIFLLFYSTSSHADSNCYGGYGDCNDTQSPVNKIESYILKNKEILVNISCSDGTGGCVEFLFIKDLPSGAFRSLKKDQTWENVYENIPKGYNLHKSEGIDFKTMTWKRSIAKKDDPNCCPSGYINMKLDIADDSLTVTHYEFITEIKY